MLQSGYNIWITHHETPLHIVVLVNEFVCGLFSFFASETWEAIFFVKSL
jgi:hypothetical protein